MTRSELELVRKAILRGAPMSFRWAAAQAVTGLLCVALGLRGLLTRPGAYDDYFCIVVGVYTTVYFAWRYWRDNDVLRRAKAAVGREIAERGRDPSGRRVH